VLGRVKKCRKKSKKKIKKYFFVLNKSQSVTHVSACIFQGLFKTIVFRSVALVSKKLWAILDFFSHTTDFLLLCVCTLPYKIKIETFFNKKCIKLLFIKSQKISRWFCQKWMSARTKTIGRVPNAPPQPV